MGFGIRVPGVRISTRGVRVGPRMANVRVSYKGRVGASAGPRLARVSVSGSGVRLGTGLGPVGASVGRGGLRVGAGAGPVFGSVGRGGARVGAGVGPLWISSNGRSKSSGRNARVLDGQSSRVRMSDSYAEYRQHLTNSGGARRNRDELRIAGINAAFSSALPVLAPLQSFDHPGMDLPTDSDLERWAKNWARQDLSSRGRHTRNFVVVPDESGDDSIRKEAVEGLTLDGVKRPTHPLEIHGFSGEILPSRQAIENWAAKKVRSERGWSKNVFRRTETKELIDALIVSSLKEFEDLHQIWLRNVADFEEIVGDRSEKIRARHAEDRKRLQLLRDEEERELARLASKRREEQDATRSVLQSIFQLYQQGDPVITTIVLQAAFSDNEGSAAPVGIDEGDLLVVMTAPQIGDVIWPEGLSVGQHLSAKKKTKTERESDYDVFLMCHSLATAKEAFAVAPTIERVKLLILDERDNDKDPLKRPVLGVLQIDRKTSLTLPRDYRSLPAINAGVTALAQWQNVTRSGDSFAIVGLAERFEASAFRSYFDFHRTGLEILSNFEKCFTMWTDLARTKRPKLVDLTEASSNTSDDVQFVDEISNEDLEVLDVSADEIETLDFWMLCALLAECWDADEVNIGELKRQASSLVESLYPFEEESIDWSLRASS